MENTPVNFREIRFNRNTKVNYKDGNPIINTIFQKYDKDNSGDFSDEEWTNYQQQLKQLEERKAEIDKLRQNINNKVVAHYSHNVDKLNKKIEKLEQKQAELISQNNFQKLMEFEKLHNVSREGYKDKSELPKNAKEYDISSFQMGIFDEKENSFTGEIYTKGYLYGFENLTKEEQTEYLNLLKDTVKTNEQIKKYEEKISELNDEIDKNLALKDLAQNGMVKKVGSSEYENNAYSQYSAIRNESNPFYKQIKELETKYSKIRLKGSPTADDKRLMEQYKIQIEQLKQASENWSISDAPKGKGLEKSDGFKLTDLSEQLTYKNQSSTDNEIKSNVQTLTDNHTLGVRYNNQNWSVNTNFTKGETYTLNSTSPDSTTDTVHTYNAYFNASYGRQDMSLSTTSNINADRVYFTDGLSTCLTSNGGGQGGKTGLYFINKPRFDKYKQSDIVETLKVAGDTPLMKVRNGTKKGFDEACIGDGINLAYPQSKTRRGRVGKGCSQTLDTNCNMGTIDDYRIRRLTPLECFRLQGFPDEMVKIARDIGLADCRLYKMAGNAITVNVAEAVARKIADCEQRTEGLEKSKTADPFNASNQVAEVENGST